MRRTMHVLADPVVATKGRKCQPDKEVGQQVSHNGHLFEAIKACSVQVPERLEPCCPCQANPSCLICHAANPARHLHPDFLSGPPAINCQQTDIAVHTYLPLQLPAQASTLHSTRSTLLPASMRHIRSVPLFLDKLACQPTLGTRSKPA
jgi:hypothetical protein